MDKYELWDIMALGRTVNKQHRKMCTTYGWVYYSPRLLAERTVGDISIYHTHIWDELVKTLTREEMVVTLQEVIEERFTPPKFIMQDNGKVKVEHAKG